jgi:hypothetical protein
MAKKQKSTASEAFKNTPKTRVMRPGRKPTKYWLDIDAALTIDDNTSFAFKFHGLAPKFGGLRPEELPTLLRDLAAQLESQVSTFDLGAMAGEAAAAKATSKKQPN